MERPSVHDFTSKEDYASAMIQYADSLERVAEDMRNYLIKMTNRCNYRRQFDKESAYEDALLRRGEE